MKRWMSISLAVLLMLSVGCGNKAEKTVEIPEDIVANETTDIDKQEEVHKFTETDFEGFFKDYFSFTEEELLILNQSRATTDEGYWDNLQKFYQPLLKQKLGKYLTDGVKNKLNTQYIKSEVDLPKWVLINDYIVSGKAEVENIQIKSTRPLGEQTVYEVAVTTVNNCYPVDTFVKDYSWGEKEGYLIKKGEGVVATNTTLDGIDIKGLENQRYIFSEKPDAIKLEQDFWITVNDSEIFKVASVTNATSWGMSTDDKNKLIDTQHITRVAFESEPTKKQGEILTQLATILMQQPESTYDYYKVAYNTNADAYIKFWDYLGLEQVFTVDKESYKVAFHREISPYKDEISSLKPNMGAITITPSVFSTKNQPRFVITIPTETLLKNNEVVYYNYKYYVGMENDKIETLQFMQIQKSNDVEYILGMSDADIAKVAEELQVDKDELIKAAQDAEMNIHDLVKAAKEQEKRPILIANESAAAKKALEDNNETTSNTTN